MERLVADLLRLARLDAGQEEIVCASCATHSVFSNVTAEIAPLLQDKHQSIEVNINEDSEMFVADPVKIHDVLKNLLENASRYSPSESVLELSANIDDKGKNILLSVRDRGSGIPDMDLPRVFERFYRVEQSRARNPGGTGLGLAIVKHLIGLHDGKIDVVNRPGGGSVFTVYLPRKGVLLADSIDGTFHHQAGFRA
tara:strand:- start:712 stop:1302 length:591 start_codon:yes stop_codon:yes gene_type:complete